MVQHTQTILRQKPTNRLSVFDHFVGMAHRGVSRLLFSQKCRVLYTSLVVEKQPRFSWQATIAEIWMSGCRMKLGNHYLPAMNGTKIIRSSLKSSISLFWICKLKNVSLEWITLDLYLGGGIFRVELHMPYLQNLFGIA